MFRFKAQIAENSVLFGRTTPPRGEDSSTQKEEGLFNLYRLLTLCARYACSRFVTQTRDIFAMKKEFMTYSELPLIFERV
ncbi:MAG: hypothetical protein ABGX83_00955 [Nitrospira sp.]|nr:hypothetical protein [Candidatus Manganitrophaceae bacterium]